MSVDYVNSQIFFTVLNNKTLYIIDLVPENLIYPETYLNTDIELGIVLQVKLVPYTKMFNYETNLIQYRYIHEKYKFISITGIEDKDLLT